MLSNKGMFPAHIPEEVLKNNPHFSSLLNKLCEKLTQDGVSQHMQRHFDLAEHNLSQARYTWFMNHIVYSELLGLLADLEVRCQEGTVIPDERQLKDVLSKTLTFGEIVDCLHIQPTLGASPSLFNLSEEVIHRHNHVKHLLPDVQQVVLPMVEDRLRKKCEELYRFLVPSENDAVEALRYSIVSARGRVIADEGLSSEHLLAAKSQTLPGIIEEKKRELVQGTELLKQDRSQRDKQFWMYYQKILESLSVMETLIKDFKLTKQVQIADVTAKWLQSKSDALCMKVRLTQLQILCDTYTAETVKALKIIGLHLDAAIKQTERDLATASQSLQAYHAVGAEFKYLVEQFTQLQHEIENRKWGLQQLTMH